MASTDCSRLELAILGVVALTNPCTAYSVRRTFADSPTKTWESNSGAIYPGIGRLIDRGLLRRSGQVTDKRGTRTLGMTPQGRAALRRWLVQAPEAGAIIPDDPVRLRLIFIAALPERDRARALDVLSEAVTVESRRHREIVDERAGTLDEITSRAVLLQLAAQRKAIDLMRDFDDAQAKATRGSRT